MYFWVTENTVIARNPLRRPLCVFCEIFLVALLAKDDGIEDVLDLDRHRHTSLTVEVPRPQAFDFLQQENRVIKPQAHFGLEGLYDNIRVPLPKRDLGRASFGNHAVSFDNSSSIIVSSQDKIPCMFDIRKPHLVPWDEPARMMCNVEIAERLEDPRVMDRIE
jgi:hypothetical protein